MLSAIEAQKKSEQWTRDNGQFIPYPSTWLNRGQWDDVIDNMSTAINSQENDDISDIFNGGRKNDGSETDN